MRKILSILLGLSLLLSLSVIATPVSAAVTGVTASLSNYCACQASVYNITFNISASLTEGVGCVCVEFPAGTTIPPTGTAWANGDILIGGFPVFGSEVTVTGTTVCFIPPQDLVPPGANPILVEFKSGAGIKNTYTPGTYSVKVNTCRAPDSTPVASATFKILPATSTYKFGQDFGQTYEGIANAQNPEEDFVLLKYCD